MEKLVRSTNLAKNSNITGIVKKFRVRPWDIAFCPKDETQNQMLNDSRAAIVHCKKP